MTMPPIHCMFDLETLGVGDNAPIVQIGAVLFSPWGDPADFGGVGRGACDPAGAGVISAPGTEFYKRVSFDRAALGAADPETIRWWLTVPSDEARRRVFGEKGYGLRAVLVEFDKWLGSWGVAPKFLWSAMDFDLRLLRQAQVACGLADRQCTWNNHKAGRDFRTLKWVGKSMGVESAPFVGVQHDALDDSYHQAYYAIKVMRKLGIGTLA